MILSIDKVRQGRWTNWHETQVRKWLKMLTAHEVEELGTLLLDRPIGEAEDWVEAHKGECWYPQLLLVQRH